MKRCFFKVLSIALVIALLCCFPINSQAAEIDESITRVNVTFNGNSQTSRGFCWYTPDECGSDVKILNYYSEGELSNAVFSGTCSKFQGSYVHKVTVDSLSPGREYKYRVGDASTDSWSNTGTFRTDDGNNEFSFIAIADVQASSDENFADAARVMKAAVDTCPDAEFYTSLGDYVNDCTNDEWNWFFKNFAFANMGMTHAPVTGNHDGNLKWNWFNSMFNLKAAENSQTLTGVYYSFDYGNTHFAVLNTNDMYPMSQQQINWLKNDMNTSDADWKIVMMHRASYSAGKNINKPDTIIMRNILVPLMDELNIDVVLAGHDHMYMRTKQVKGDKVVENVEYTTEFYKGEEITFAVNPEGTVNILPSTAGTKRYAVNENAVNPISECAAVSFSTRDLGGCFTTIQIDNDKLIYKAYILNDDTGESELVDQYAIKKTVGQNTVDPNYQELPTDFASNIEANISSFIAQLLKMLATYFFTLVPQLISKAF